MGKRIGETRPQYNERRRLERLESLQGGSRPRRGTRGAKVTALAPDAQGHCFGSDLICKHEGCSQKHPALTGAKTIEPCANGGGEVLEEAPMRRAQG